MSQKLSTETVNAPLRVAFLGGAYDSAAGRAHRTAIEMDKRFSIVAGVFSRDAEKNHATALQYDVSTDRIYKNLDELIKNERAKIDAIVILSPTDQHKSQVISCLSAGIPVICEKALATSVEEGEEIKEHLTKHKGFLAVTYNYTGYPMLRELKSMIARGQLGKIQQIHAEMPQEGFARCKPDGSPITPQEWRLRDGKIPTLSLDLGVHLHMAVKFLTSETPTHVVAAGHTFGNFDQVKDDISCIIKYTNQLSCNVWYSKTALGQRNGFRLRIFGERASAEWLQEEPEYLHIADSFGRKSLIDRASGDVHICNQPRYSRFKAGHPAGFIEAFANYYYDLAESLQVYRQQGRCWENPYVFGLEESLEGFRLFEAIEKSSNELKWIQISQS